MALAAVAALVGCSKENTPMDVVAKDNFAINASIVLDDTRVTVEGEHFTDVKWVAGDEVTLSSKNGASAMLAAESDGDTDIRFVGEGSAVADTDTYYAIYPATAIVDGVATIDLATQSGSDAAVLVSKAEGNKDTAIDMAFKPANALLHVAVSGVSSLSKAEFVAYDGAMLPQSFTYDFESESVATTGEVAAYTIEKPSVDGFFFSLPADLNLANGYVVRLTDASGNVCSKAYNAKMFAKATTTRVTIEWSTPSVTLGTPMTSYSYYAAGDSKTANSCANNVIYFPTASSYTNIQNAMIAEVGYIIDGTKYVATLDTATKSFSMGNVTVSSWGAKSVEAFVKTKDGRTIKSTPATVHITGLPYSYNFVNGSLDAYRNAGWSTNGTLRVSSESLADHSSTLVLHHYRSVFFSTTNESGFVVSPKFCTPSDISVQPQIIRHAYSAGVITTNITKTGYVGAVNSTTSKSTTISFSDTTNNTLSDATSGSGDWMESFSISPSYPYISVSCCTNVKNSGTYYFLYEAHFRYAE